MKRNHVKDSHHLWGSSIKHLGCSEARALALTTEIPLLGIHWVCVSHSWPQSRLHGEPEKCPCLSPTPNPLNSISGEKCLGISICSLQLPRRSQCVARTVSSQVTHRGASQVDFYNKSQRGFSESQDVLLVRKSRAQFGSWSGLRLDLPASVSDVFLGNGNEGRGWVLEHKTYGSWILFPQMELWVKWGNLMAAAWKMVSGTQLQWIGSQWEVDSDPKHPRWSMMSPKGLGKLQTGILYVSTCYCLWLTIRRDMDGFSLYLTYWAFHQAHRETNSLSRGLVVLLFHCARLPEVPISFSTCKEHTKGMKRCQPQENCRHLKDHRRWLKKKKKKKKCTKHFYEITWY